MNMNRQTGRRDFLKVAEVAGLVSVPEPSRRSVSTAFRWVRTLCSTRASTAASISFKRLRRSMLVYSPTAEQHGHDRSSVKIGGRV